MEEEAAQEQEDRHAQLLRRDRAKSGGNPAEQSAPPGEEIEKLEKLAANKDKIVTFVLVPVIAGGNAFLNYLVMGAIPIVGDAIDLGAGATISALLFTLEGHARRKAQIIMWGLTAVELIPGADIASPQAIGAGIALIIAWRAGSKAEEKLEELQKK